MIEVVQGAVTEEVQAPAPVLWTRPDLEVALSMSRTATYDLIRRPDFPKGIRLRGENSQRRWYANEVLAFMERLRRDGGKA